MDENLFQHSVANPGHMFRDHAEKAAFTSELIKALEDASVLRRESTRDQQRLADAAFDKLQYDFPLVSAEELAALIECHRHHAGYPLSPKYLAVVREGATAAAGDGVSSDTPSNGGPLLGSSPSQPADPQLAHYQQLYAVILVKALQAALGEWDAAACSRHLGQLLPSLQPDAPQAANSRPETVMAEANLACGRGLAAAVPEQPAIPNNAPAAQARSIEYCATQSLQYPQGQMLPVVEDVAAEDSDEMAYEPLDSSVPPQTPNMEVTLRESSSGRPGVSASSRAWQQEQHLVPMLCHLAGLLSWHCLGDDSVWREQSLLQELATCLGLLRRHEAFPRLAQGVGEPLLQLVVARLGSCPSEAAGFGSILDALGLSEAQPIAPEAARLALAASAMLARQLSSPSAQRTLWQQVHSSLLPLAASQLDGLQAALAKRAKQAATAPAATGTAASRRLPVVAAAQPAAVPAALLSGSEQYCLMACCEMLYFYVLRAPQSMLQGAGARLEQALLAGGLFRALVLLFVQLAALEEAEALRCALLLSCAASKGLCQWAAAVPGFKATALSLSSSQLAEQAGQGERAISDPSLGQRLAGHGALWSLLLEGGAGGVAGGAAKGTVGGPRLVHLLKAAAASPAQAVGAMELLQLMAAVHHVSRPRYPWPASVEASLRQLDAALKEHSRLSRQAAATQAAAPAAGAAAKGQSLDKPSSSCEQPSSVQGTQRAFVAPKTSHGGGLQSEPGPAGQDGVDDEDSRKLRVASGTQAELLAERRVAQLQPVCLRLLKELLEKQGAGGKHD
ncbi:hypothetical protein N2152v2_004992 [Parachlorella kessleri]